MKHLLFLLAIIILFSCKPDTNAVDMTQLEGDWVVLEAFRDNQQTGTLKDATFTFMSDKMISNVLGSSDPVSISYNGNLINQTEGEGLSFEVTKFENDTLYLNSDIRNHAFRFVLIQNDESSE